MKNISAAGKEDAEFFLGEALNLIKGDLGHIVKKVSGLKAGVEKKILHLLECVQACTLYRHVSMKVREEFAAFVRSAASAIKLPIGQYNLIL